MLFIFFLTLLNAPYLLSINALYKFIHGPIKQGSPSADTGIKWSELGSPGKRGHKDFWCISRQYKGLVYNLLIKE